MASGANVKAVQRMLGHASAAMTLDVYSGLFDDDLGALAERMDAAHEASATRRHGTYCGHRVGTGPCRRDRRSRSRPLTWTYIGGAGGARTHDPGIMSTCGLSAVLTSEKAGRG